MRASCDPSQANQSSSAPLAVYCWRMVLQLKTEERETARGVQSLSDTSHFGITSHNGVIISSLSQSKGLPFSLTGRLWAVRVGCAQVETPHQEKTHSRSHTIHLHLSQN
ncbi:hypothetical protein AMECASPLE_006568 [Ameca splendens]|uniref:Uncharacterized protein n=1 Tax=Ameca splendens TaxID=208324 RepID=A0ABV0XNQ1_9TELE